MISFLDTQRISRVVLRGLLLLSLSFFLHQSADASPNKNNAIPEESAHDVIFAGDDRVPESLKEEKKNQNNDHGVIDNDG